MASHVHSSVKDDDDAGVNVKLPGPKCRVEVVAQRMDIRWTVVGHVIMRRHVVVTLSDEFSFFVSQHTSTTENVLLLLLFIGVILLGFAKL